jgi:2-C-methyl-D-erythritol 4-phosphate cytidylyltransferase
MKASAIIVAAGSGIRLGAEIPKAFVQIGGLSMLARVLRTIGQVTSIGEVVIAVPAGREKLARLEVASAELQIPAKILAGGMRRQDSVRRALRVTSSEADFVVVHDAARPFATASMFEACIAAATQSGGAILGVPVADTLKHVEDQWICATVPRGGLWQAQTPQVFRRELLLRAHASGEPFDATDDADLVERLAIGVAIVDGSPINLKVTTPDDLRLAEAIVKFVLAGSYS